MELMNHDGTFFEVTSPDVQFDTIAAEDVISLEFTEAVKQMTQGSLTLFDPRMIYAKILRPGVRLKIKWGIRNGIVTLAERELPEVMVNAPSGAGSAGGQVTYSCSFMSLGWRGDHRTVVYDAGTKGDVVAQVLARMGAVAWRIDFDRQYDALGDAKVVQSENDFRFLVRMADEWQAAFTMGWVKGVLVGNFLKHSAINTALGSFTTSLNYGGRDANVLSYSWQDESASSGTGDGVMLNMGADGKPQIIRRVVQGETVVTWRLVPELVEEELKVRDWSDRTALMVEYLKVKDFEQVKRFFVQDTQTTAPQGSGMTLKVEMLGNPYLTCASVVRFAYGFPERIGAKDRRWWTRSVTHKIDRSGYFCSLDIADAWSFSQTGTVLALTSEGVW